MVVTALLTTMDHGTNILKGRRSISPSIGLFLSAAYIPLTSTGPRRNVYTFLHYRPLALTNPTSLLGSVLAALFRRNAPGIAHYILASLIQLFRWFALVSSGES